MNVGSEWGGEGALQILVLGPIIVYRPDGTAVKGLLWGRSKVRALLALLALSKDHLIHRDRIMTLLWPNKSRKAALKNLNTTIYSLRLCLEPDLVDGSDSCYLANWGGGVYGLREDVPILVDATTFEACAREIRVATDADHATCLCHKAMALYRGDLLADLAPNLAIFEAKRTRFRTLYFETIEELASLYEGRQREDEATELYLKLLDLDPARVSAAVQLVRLTLRRGDYQATRYYEQRLHQAIAEKKRLLVDSNRLYSVEENSDIVNRTAC